MAVPYPTDISGQELDELVEGAESYFQKPWKRFWAPSWSRRRGVWGWQFPLEVFLIGLILVAAPYFITNNIADARGVTVLDPELGLDRDIPVIYWTILPYSLLYLFYPVTLMLCPKDDRGHAELAVGMQTLILVTFFCCTIFLILPAEIDLRDQIDWEAMNAWETILFEFIHFSDNPWNAWPSLHIVHSYLLARLMTHWTRSRTPDSLGWNIFLVVLWLEWALLCISIMTTKQHFAFDLVSGLIVAHMAWRFSTPSLGSIGEIWPLEFSGESRSSD